MHTQNTNTFFKSFSLQIGEHKVNFDHYRVLQEVESKQQLRVVPKLTKEHVAPDNLRKMNVRLAVQVGAVRQVGVAVAFCITFLCMCTTWCLVLCPTAFQPQHRSGLEAVQEASAAWTAKL